MPKEKEPEKHEAPERADVLTDKLIKARTVFLIGEVNDKSAARIIAELLVLEADDPQAPITLIVNSPGGSVTAGFAIYDVIRFVRPRVRVVCAGLTASIATVVLLAATKEDRFALPNARLLIHQPLLTGTIYGPASDLEITANEILRTRQRINTLLATETGQPSERIEADTQRDYWLGAEEAMAYGLVCKVVTERSELD
jgi:ATP-dependent Clp protease protease subunit